MTTFYCIDKSSKSALLAGPVPAVWGTISGLSDVRGADLEDLSWAGYPNHGFLTAEQALAQGVTQDALDAALAVAARIEGGSVRARRNQLLAESDWTQLPDVPSETKALWAAHRQALRDVPAQPGFPWDFDWPVAP